MRIESEVYLDYDDVLIRPKRSNLISRADVDLVRSYHFLWSHFNYSGVPIIAANMDGVGTPKMANALEECEAFTCLTKFIPITDVVDTINKIPYAVAPTIGGNPGDLEWLDMVAENTQLYYLNIDVANGYREDFVDFVKSVREHFKESLTIFAGNVASPEMTEALLLAGADVVKVGIGPGQFCETRKVTGIGIPQLSAVIECADAAHGLGGHIIADGGCKTSGDVAKAFGAGADFVMLGTMLAGHDEGLTDNERSFYVKEQGSVEFHGMSSTEAMKNHYGSKAAHRASEGRSGTVPYKGPVAGTMEEILGGLRSTCSYVGAETLKQLPKCTTFVRVSK